MVDFSTRATDVNTQIVPDTRVVDPVSRNNEIDALQSIGRGVALGAKTVATFFQNKDNLAANKRLGEMQLKLLDLSTAEGQGMSAQEVRTRSQLILKQSIANDPGQADDYQNGYAKWMNNTGYDKVADPRVQQAEFDQAIAMEAVKGGYINPNDWNDPVKVKQGIENYTEFTSSIRDMERTQKQLSIQSSREELTSKERARLKVDREETTLTGLSKVANAALPYWKAQYDDIVAQASKAPDQTTRAKLIQDGITRMRNDLLSKKIQLSGDSLALGQDKIDQVWKPIDNMIELYSQQLDGTIDLETMNKRTASLQAQSKWMMLNDIGEEGRQFAALSDISKNMADVLGPRITNKVLDIWTKNSNFNGVSDKTPKSPDERAEGKPPANLFYEQDAKTYLDGMAGAISRVNGGKVDEGTKTEINTQMEGILKGVDVYANANTSAKQFQPIVDFFSNPAVGTYLTSGGKVPDGVAAAARQVIGDGYQQQVVPLLKNEVQSKILGWDIRIGDKKYVGADLFEPTMESGKFAFKLKAGVESNMAVASTLKSANSSAFTKVMNKMIMANAHMSGTTDYNKSYEELAPLVFQDAFSTDPEGRQAYIPASEVIGNPITGFAEGVQSFENEMGNSSQGVTASGRSIGTEAEDFTLEDLVTPISAVSANGTPTPRLEKAASGPYTGQASGFMGKTDPIEIARSFDGMTEAKDAAVIASFIKKSAGININPATTAWCAAFVNAVLGASGQEGNGRLNARSFLSWGQAVDTPSEGDVVVFERGGKNSWKGHVGFYVGEEMKGGEKYIRVLSGNQSNSVNESLYPAKRLLGYRRALN